MYWAWYFIIIKMKPCDKLFLDENMEKIAAEIEKGMNREKVLTPATMPLCPDERISKGNYSKREIGLNHYEVVEQASDSGIDQNDINKAIGKTSIDKKLTIFERASKIFSDIYYNYLSFRKKIHLPKEVIEIGQLTGTRLTDIIKLVNPGGLVFLKDGTYNTTAALDMLDNVTLDGAGWGATIIDNGATNDDLIECNAKTNWAIKNLQLNGNPGGGNNIKVITCTGVNQYYEINHIFINGSDTHAIYFAQAQYGTVIRCYIYNPDTDCVFGNITKSRIINNYFSTPGQDGIGTSGAASAIINSNVLFNTSRYGIYISNISGRNTIIGNIIHTTANDGIFLASGCDNNIVTSNKITLWTNEAIDDDGSNNLIHSNQVL